MHFRARIGLVARARLALGRELLASYGAASRAARRAASSAVAEGGEVLGAGEAEASPRAVFVNQELDISSLKWVGEQRAARGAAARG